MLIVILSFVIGLATDWVYTKYFRSVANHQAFYAANWSVGLYICGIFATWLLIDEAYFAMIAYVVGGYLGTYFAVKHGEPKNDVDEQRNSVSL